MDTYDFSRLSSNQEWLLLCGGWRIGQTYPDGSIWFQPSARTVKKLIDRGLLFPVEVRDSRGGLPSMTVTEYRVPIDVHRAYCMYSACKGCI